MNRNCIFIFCFGLFFAQFVRSQDIKVHYLGHSAFVIQFDSISVVTDYGKINAWKQWGWDSPIYSIGELIPDIITYSHLHEDHYDSTRIPKGVKHILKNNESIEYKDLKIIAIATSEDQFGEFNNTSYLFSYKDFNVLHTGDIQGMIANIKNDSVANYFKENFQKNIDVLIMPIEGKMKYIPETLQFIQLLSPQKVIPTHYWSEEYLEEFILIIGEEYDIKEIGELQLKIKSNSVSDKTEIIVLNRFPF